MDMNRRESMAALGALAVGGSFAEAAPRVPSADSLLADGPTYCPAFVKEVGEIRQLVGKYGDHPALVAAGARMGTLAVLLENNFNTTHPNKISDHIGDPQAFGAAVIGQMFGPDYIGYELFNIWPALWPTTNVFQRVNDRIEIAPRQSYLGSPTVKTSNRRVIFSSRMNPATFDPAARDELISIIAQELGMEVTRGAIKHMRDNAAKYKTSNAERLIGQITDKAKVKPTWAILSTDNALILGLDPRSDSFAPSLGIRHVGEKYGLKVFADPLFPTGQILLGNHGKLFEAGYTMYPHTMFSTMGPTHLVDGNKVPTGEVRWHTYTRAAATLRKKNAYSLIAIG